MLKGLTAAAMLAAAASFAAAVETEFTYQGVLEDAGVPANGPYDIRFRLFDQLLGGTELGLVVLENLPVSGGQFTAELDYGSVFSDGLPRWLQIEVRPGASGGVFTTLGPRQQIRPTPHAMHAETANLLQTRFADGVLGVESFLNSESGELLMRRSDGTIVVDFGPNAGSPSGGEMKLYNNSGVQTFDLDGDISESGEPYMFIAGLSSALFFDAEFGIFDVPIGSITASEIADEPGVASANEGFGAPTVSSTTLTSILTRTITCPTSGYVLVIATGQVQFSHVTGTQSGFNFGVSDSASSIPVNQDVSLTVGSQIPSTFLSLPVTVHGLFSVSAGANQFYFLGQHNSSASPSASVFDSQLTCVFIPTAYGTVTSTFPLASTVGGNDSGPTRLGLTPSELAAEREQSIAQYQARVEAELAAIREEVAALRELRREERSVEAQEHDEME